jgi:hypothetical protein
MMYPKGEEPDSDFKTYYSVYKVLNSKFNTSAVLFSIPLSCFYGLKSLEHTIRNVIGTLSYYLSSLVLQIELGENAGESEWERGTVHHTAVLTRQGPALPEASERY